jgi:hypothetical protein
VFTNSPIASKRPGSAIASAFLVSIFSDPLATLAVAAEVVRVGEPVLAPVRALAEGAIPAVSATVAGAVGGADTVGATLATATVGGKGVAAGNGAAVAATAGALG